MLLRMLAIIAVVSALTSDSFAQQKFVANYDEAKIPDFKLPDPLVTEAGKPVTDAATWNSVRRRELLELFKSQVYGHGPASVPDQPSYRQHESTMPWVANRSAAKSMSSFRPTKRGRRCDC